MPSFDNVKHWSRHAERLLRYNHLTMTLSAGQSTSGAFRRRTNARKQCDGGRMSTITIQYTFDSSAHFPRPFLASSPSFDFSFNPALRTLPCIIILHGSEPGGFDVARWIAAGLSHAQHVSNPLMPNSFGSYFGYNIQQQNQHQSEIKPYPPSKPSSAESRNLHRPRKKQLEHSSQHEQLDISGIKKYHVPTPPMGLLGISRPGFLLSSMTRDLTFQSEAHAIIRLLDNLRIGSVGVISHGTSAPVAMELASLPMFRDRMRSLTFIDPTLTPTSSQVTSLRARSSMWPEWLQSWVAYKHYARDTSDPVFLHSLAEMAGPAAVNELLDDPVFAELYSDIGVFFTSYNMRRPGVKADIEKMANLAKDSDRQRRWSLACAPILCVTASRTKEEVASGKFNKESVLREEQSQAALMHTQSTIKQFSRVLGGGESLFPLGAVSHLCLEFLRDYGQIDYQPQPIC